MSDSDGGDVGFRVALGVAVWVGFVITLLLYLAACAPAEALTLDRLTFRLVADSLHVRVPLQLPAGADSARITVTVTPGGSRGVTARSAATAVTAVFLAPAEGDTVMVRACGVAWRRGVVGPESCNTAQRWVRPITPPGPITWPDTMQISGMHWPDSGSVALIQSAWADALPWGPLVVVTWADTLARAEWASWGDAILVRPAAGCSTACRQLLLTDTRPHSLAARNWAETRGQVWRFAKSPRYQAWWDSVRALHS